MTDTFCFARNCWLRTRVRRGVVIVKEPGLFLPKFGATSSHVFTQSPQNFTVEPGVQFGLLGPALRAATTAVQMAASDRNILDITSHKTS
jgi:hypothetical protein